MYELFVMPLKEYWSEDDPALGVENVTTLQKDLSELFGHEVCWKEPESFAQERDEDEIDVAAFTDVQFDALQALAAALEMGKTADDLNFDENGIVDPEIFETFAEYADEHDVKRFPQILWLGHSMESFMIPPDFDQVVEVGDTDDECDCECECDHEDGECCCCEDDTSSIDVASLPAIRRELDDMAKVLDLKSDLSLDDIETVEFDDEDLLREAKVAWYILNARINEAIESKLPLIMRFSDDDDDEDAFDDDRD